MDLLDEGDHVGDMLGHAVVVAGAVPMLGKEMPQADADDAVFPRQRPKQGKPGAEIAERAVHANERVASARLEIGHVIAVESDRLHVQSARKSRTISENFCGACSNIGCVAFGIIATFEFGTCAASACSTFATRPLVLAPPMNNVGIRID